MTDRTALLTLADRLEREEPSGLLCSQISDDITRVLYGPMWTLKDWGKVKTVLCDGSLDAALALFREVLPGWSWELRCSGYGNTQANLWRPDVGPPAICPQNQNRSQRNDQQPAMTLLAAVCRAKAGER